jgi:hypothetical protein
MGNLTRRDLTQCCNLKVLTVTVELTPTESRRGRAGRRPRRPAAFFLQVWPTSHGHALAQRIGSILISDNATLRVS